MQVEIPTPDDITTLLDSLERHPIGAGLLILLILSVAVVVYCWRWAPKAPPRSRSKPRGLINTTDKGYDISRKLF
jgi:hypothetical protein